MSAGDHLQQQFDRELGRIEDHLDEMRLSLAALVGKDATALIRDPKRFYELTRSASAAWRCMIELEELLDIRRPPRR